MKQLKKIERTTKNEDVIKKAEAWLTQGQVFGFIKDVLSVMVQEDAVIIYYEDNATVEEWLEENIEKQTAYLQRLANDYQQMLFEIAAGSSLYGNTWAYEERKRKDETYQMEFSEGNAQLKRLQTRLSEIQGNKPVTSSKTSVIEVLLSKYRKQLHAAENWLSAHPNDASHLVQREVLLEIIRDLEAL